MSSILRPTALAVSVSLLLGISAASAQQTWVKVDDAAQLPGWNVTADAAEDLNVLVNGAKVGEIEEVIGTDRNTPTAVTVDFDDKAGFGDRDDVVIPLANFAPATGGVTLNSDANAVAGFPVWDD